MSNETMQATNGDSCNAPSVTADDVERIIKSTWYFNGSDMPVNQFQPPVPAKHPLCQLTICVLVLKNGFTVVGQSACASPDKFDAAEGRQLARKDAIRQVWPLVGYMLRNQLAREAEEAACWGWLERVREEHRELTHKITKLSAFLGNGRNSSTTVIDWNLLVSQESAMKHYAKVLASRIHEAEAKIARQAERA